MPGHDGILVQETRLHSRQTSIKNEQMPTGSVRTWMDNQRKYHIDSEGSPQGNRPKQLQTDNLPSDDVENINSTNKGRDLLLTNKPQIVPWELQIGSWCTGELLYIDQHILNKSKTWQKNLTMTWTDYKRQMIWFHEAG